MNTSLEDIRILCDTDIEADIKELDYNQKLQYLIDLSNKVAEHLEMLEKVLEEDFDSSQDEMKLSKKELIEYLNMGKDLEINKLGLENSIKELSKR